MKGTKKREGSVSISRIDEGGGNERDLGLHPDNLVNRVTQCQSEEREGDELFWVHEMCLVIVVIIVDTQQTEEFKVPITNKMSVDS